MPRGRLRPIAANRRKSYERMRAKGTPKSRAAKIANAGQTKAGRSRMAKKAARSRKKRRS